MFASVPAGLCGPAEDAKWSRGMAMSMKEKLFFLWLLVVVAFSFVVRHFWASTIYVLGRAVALNLVSLPSLAKFAVVICGVHLLP
jgi:hypothetical protein